MSQSEELGVRTEDVLSGMGALTIGLGIEVMFQLRTESKRNQNRHNPNKFRVQYVSFN